MTTEALGLISEGGAEYALKPGEEFVWIKVGRYSFRLARVGDYGHAEVAVYYEGAISLPPVAKANTWEGAT